MSSIVKLFDKHWISTVFCNTWLVWAVPAGAVPLYVIRLDIEESDPQGLFCTVQCCNPPLCLPWSVMEGWDLSASSFSPMGYPGLWAPVGLAAWEETAAPVVLSACLIQKADEQELLVSLPPCLTAFKWRVQSLALADNALACCLLRLIRDSPMFCKKKKKTKQLLISYFIYSE